VKVGAKVGMAVSAKARIATAEEIGRTGLIVGVFGRFEVEVRSSGKF
jgi:hypothetical protein